MASGAQELFLQRNTSCKQFLFWIEALRRVHDKVDCLHWCSQILSIERIDGHLMLHAKNGFVLDWQCASICENLKAHQWAVFQQMIEALLHLEDNVGTLQMCCLETKHFEQVTMNKKFSEKQNAQDKNSEMQFLSLVPLLCSIALMQRPICVWFAPFVFVSQFFHKRKLCVCDCGH